MATYTWYDLVTRKRVYEVDLPSNWAEISKMMSAVQNALEEKEPGSSRWDTAAEFTSDGEKLFLSFELEEKREKAPEIESIDDQERNTITDANDKIVGWIHPGTGVFYDLSREHRNSKGHFWRWAGGFEADEEILGGLFVPIMNLVRGVVESERRTDVRLTHVLRDHGPLRPVERT